MRIVISNFLVFIRLTVGFSCFSNTELEIEKPRESSCGTTQISILTYLDGIFSTYRFYAPGLFKFKSKLLYVPLQLVV